MRYLLGRRIYCVTSEGELEHSLPRYAQELRRGGKVAKVAAKIKLLEWIYHMMRDCKTFQQVENAVELLGRGEPVKNSGL